jgi:hypothetical protein
LQVPPRDAKQEIAQMKSSTLRGVAARSLSVPLDLLTEQGTGSATIEISHSVTSDIPDGRQWPPPDSNALWVAVRRAKGCTLWRAFQLAQSDPLPTDFAIANSAAIAMTEPKND